MRNFIVVLAILGLVAAGCGDDEDGEDEIEETEQELEEDAEGADRKLEEHADEAEQGLEETAGEAGARAAAETVRASLTARELGEDEHLRDMAVLEDATGDVPGDPEVGGLEDSDGDGRDDDGLVELKVGDESACVSVSEDGETVNVEGGACS